MTCWITGKVIRVRHTYQSAPNKELSATTFYLQLSSETKKHFAVTGFLRPFLAALVAAALSAGLL